MTEEDVNGLLDCHSETLTEEDLAEMTKSASEEEEEPNGNEEEEEEERGLTLANLHEVCGMARALERRVAEIDDDMVRAVEFGNRLDAVMTTYKNILQQKIRQRQQLPITMFLVKRKPPAAPSSGASTSAAEPLPPRTPSPPPRTPSPPPRTPTPPRPVSPVPSEGEIIVEGELIDDPSPLPELPDEEASSEEL